MKPKPKIKPVKAYAVLIDGKIDLDCICTTRRAAEFVASNVHEVARVEIRPLPAKRKVRK